MTIKQKTKKLLRWLQAFENQQLSLALIAAALPSLLVLMLMVVHNHSGYALLIVAMLLTGIVCYCAITIRQRSIYAFRTLANLLETMIQGDYSLRGRHANVSDALDEVMARINTLANTLANQSLQTRESQLLLQKVTDQIDVAVLAVDDDRRVSFINPATARLLGKESAHIIGKSLADLGLQPLINVDRRQLVALNIGRHSGKFYVYSDRYFEQGQRFRLLLITDIQRILQEEERQAWQNLLRVLNHEINNSLTPIASISDTLRRLSDQQTMPETVRERFNEGTAVIKERANALSSFISNYGQLTHLAEPHKQPLSVAQLIGDLRPLFQNRTITIETDADLTVYADRTQMQQLFLNLLKNADEAMDDQAGVITVSWAIENDFVTIRIRDQGCGIANPDNLFVPFYSTKGRGSGIGLALSRQIVFNHYGRLLISNRSDQQGAEAVIALPHAA